MSQYIQILNAIKKNIGRLSLTKGQADCRFAILERLEYPGVVNLYGPHGSGKTFLGWDLANDGRATYVVEPVQLAAAERLSSIFFIDNAGHRHNDYRRILGDLERIRANKAIIVTLERIEDSVQAFDLHCTPEDIQLACANLAQLRHPAVTESLLDLWDVLQHAARESDYAK